MLVAQEEIAHDNDVSERHALTNQESARLQVVIEDLQHSLQVSLCTVAILKWRGQRYNKVVLVCS